MSNRNWTLLWALAMLALGATAAARAGGAGKLYVETEQDIGAGTVLFIQDLETGTRCYAISQNFHDGGAAISCIAKGAR